MKPGTDRRGQPPTSAPAQARLPRGSSIVGSVKAISWAFLGLRAGREQQQDAARVSPLLWIGIAIVAVFVFVLALIALVRWLVPALGQSGS